MASHERQGAVQNRRALKSGSVAKRDRKGGKSRADWPGSFCGRRFSASQWRSFQVFRRCTLYRGLVLCRGRSLYGTGDRLYLWRRPHNVRWYSPQIPSGRIRSPSEARGPAIPRRLVHDHKRWRREAEIVRASPTEVSSNPHHLNAELLKGRYHLIGCARVGDEDIQFRRLANPPIGHYSEFSAVYHRNASSSQLQHGRVQLRFVCTEATGSPCCVDAVRPYEHGIDEHVFQGAYRCRSDERKPLPMQMSARDKHIDIPALGEFHGHIHRVGYDGDTVVHGQAANHFRGGRARRESDRLTGVYQSCRRSSDATFFIGGPLDLSYKRTILAEGLVEQRLHRDCPTMRAPEQSLLLENVKVTPNRY